MAVATVAEVKEAVADVMQAASVSELSARWDRIITEAVDDGLRDIVSAMALKGYSPDQITQWDRFHSLHMMQAEYWAFVKGAGLHNFDDRWINKLDQRQFLKELAATGDGGILVPVGQPGAVAFAMLDTATDKYTRDMQL